MGSQISSSAKKAAAASENHPQGTRRDSIISQQELRDSTTRTSDTSTRIPSQDVAPRRDVALPSSSISGVAYPENNATTDKGKGKAALQPNGDASQTSHHTQGISTATASVARKISIKTVGCSKPDFMVGAPPAAQSSLGFARAHSERDSDVDEDDFEDTGSSSDDQSEHDMAESAYGTRPLPSSSPTPHVAPRAEAGENAPPVGILTKRSQIAGSLVVNGPLVQRGQCCTQMSYPVRRHVTFQDAPTLRHSDTHRAAQDSRASEAAPDSTAQASPSRPRTAPAAVEQASRDPPVAATPSMNMDGISHTLGGLVEESVGYRGSLFAKQVKSGPGVLYDTQVNRHPFWAYPPPDISESNRELDRELEESRPIIDGFDDDFMDAYCDLYAHRTDVIEKGMEMHQAEFEHLYERFLSLKLKLEYMNDERESLLTDGSSDMSWLSPKLRKQLLIKIAHDEQPLKEEFPHAERELEECLMRGRTKLAAVLRPDFALPNAIEGWRTRVRRKKAAEEESEELGTAAAMIGLRGLLKDQSFAASQVIQRNAQLVVDEKLKEFGQAPRGAKLPFLSLEESFNSLVSTVPAWFTVFEAKGILMLDGATPLDRLKLLLRIIANSAVSTQPVREEAAESAEATPTKQFHEPNPGWRTEKQRQCGGWFTCRSGPDATVAEVICRLCHPKGAATTKHQEPAAAGPAPRADHMTLIEQVELAMAEANERDRLTLKYQLQQEQADFERYWQQRERSRNSGSDEYLEPLNGNPGHETNSRLSVEPPKPWQHQSSMINTDDFLAEGPEDNCDLPDLTDLTGPTGPTGPSSVPSRPTDDHKPRFVRLPSSAPVCKQADTAARPPHQAPPPPPQPSAQQGGPSQSAGLSIEDRIDHHVHERVQRRMRLLRMSRAEREELRRQGPEPVGPSWRDAFRYRPGEPPGRQLRKKWKTDVNVAQLLQQQMGVTATQPAPPTPALQVTRYSHDGHLNFNWAAHETQAEAGPATRSQASSQATLIPSRAASGAQLQADAEAEAEAGPSTRSQASSQATLIPSRAASGAQLQADAEDEAEAGPTTRSNQSNNTGTLTPTGAGPGFENVVAGPSSSSRQSQSHHHGRSDNHHHHNNNNTSRSRSRSRSRDVISDLSQTPRGRTRERRAAGTGIGNGNAARRAEGARSTSAVTAHGGRARRVVGSVLARPSVLRRSRSSGVRGSGRREGREGGTGNGNGNGNGGEVGKGTGKGKGKVVSFRE